MNDRIAEIRAEQAHRYQRIAELWPTHTPHEIAKELGGVLTDTSIRTIANEKFGLLKKDGPKR